MATSAAGPYRSAEVVFPVSIRTGDTTQRIEVYADEFVLDGARRHGIALPSLCRQGWCTRCAVRVEDGQLDQSASRRFFEADRQAGYALICTGRPLSPLWIETHQHEAFREHRIAAGLPVPRG